MDRYEVRGTAGADEALRQLHASQRARFSRFKRAFVPVDLPATVVTGTGVVCHHRGEPAAALVWQHADTGRTVASADYFAEAPGADETALAIVLNGFLAQTPAAREHYFEQWTPAGSRIHSVLRRHGFAGVTRQLLALADPIPVREAPGEFTLRRWAERIESAADLEPLAQMLREGYAGTPDGGFYVHLGTAAGCAQHLRSLTTAAAFGAEHSFVAYARNSEAPAGMILCSNWTDARALYIEQLVVHPRFRGQRLGRQLLTEVSRVLQIGTILNILLTVSAAHTAARALYDAAGFCLVDTEFAYRRGSVAPR